MRQCHSVEDVSRVCAAPLELIVDPACDALVCARFSGAARMQRNYQVCDGKCRRRRQLLHAAACSCSTPHATASPGKFRHQPSTKFCLGRMRLCAALVPRSNHACESPPSQPLAVLCARAVEYRIDHSVGAWCCPISCQCRCRFVTLPRT
jgi:hypothetical protein